MENKVLVVLTQYKRQHLKTQLIQLAAQTQKPDYLVVFQNENHVDISNLKEIFNFIHIKSDYNTKFFGRFAACFTFPVEYCIVMDDDMIPGKNFVKNYVDQCRHFNAIIGGNGRIGYFNENKARLKTCLDTGKRDAPLLTDFVGHVWCFKRMWLHMMFTFPPLTFDTGEDMHFCYSAKILGNINSIIAKQVDIEDWSDITDNKLCSDEFSSFKTTSFDLRKNVEQRFLQQFNLQLIKEN